MVDIEYYDNYEAKLQIELLKLCSSLSMLDGVLLESEDIELRWKELAPHYMADAVHQINSFPAAAIAWAGYVGMAVAHRWDENWAEYSNEPYEALYGAEKFDDMDENIVQNILHIELGSELSDKIESVLRSCAHMAMTYIRREEVESQSTKAFYILARTVRVLFRIGAAMELKRLGYKFEKMQVGEPTYN